MKTIQKTEVCITVDTEFSIAGAFREPERLEPVGSVAAWCEIDGESHGVGFLLRELAATNLTATFFVEALNVHYFGDEVMGRVVRHLAEAGQDVQIHLHPCWRAFEDPDWRDRVRANPPGDSMAGRTVDDAVDVIRDGLAVFDRWSVPGPVALRTGSLRTDLNVYRAMARLDLPLASNVGIAVYRPDEPRLRLTGGRHEVEGVLEIPVLAYEDVRVAGYRHLKNWTITGCSTGETRSLLTAARRLGVETVVLLTHPFEFAKHDERYEDLKPNRVNQRRFRRLCRFLAERPDQFEVVTFGGHERWRAAGACESPTLRVGLHRTIGRLVENRLNDTF